MAPPFSEESLQLRAAMVDGELATAISTVRGEHADALATVTAALKQHAADTAKDVDSISLSSAQGILHAQTQASQAVVDVQNLVPRVAALEQAAAAAAAAATADADAGAASTEAVAEESSTSATFSARLAAVEDGAVLASNSLLAVEETTQWGKQFGAALSARVAVAEDGAELVGNRLTAMEQVQNAYQQQLAEISTAAAAGAEAAISKERQEQDVLLELWRGELTGSFDAQLKVLTADQDKKRSADREASMKATGSTVTALAQKWFAEKLDAEMAAKTQELNAKLEAERAKMVQDLTVTANAQRTELANLRAALEATAEERKASDARLQSLAKQCQQLRAMFDAATAAAAAGAVGAAAPSPSLFSPSASAASTATSVSNSNSSSSSSSNGGGMQHTRHAAHAVIAKKEENHSDNDCDEEEEEEEAGAGGVLKNEHQHQHQHQHKMEAEQAEIPIVLCFSGFKRGNKGYEPKDKEHMVEQARTILNASVLDSYNPTCTHLVCPPKTRTMKTIQAVLEGSWVGRKDWLMAALAARRQLPTAGYGVQCAVSPFATKLFAMSTKFIAENTKKEKRQSGKIANFKSIVKAGKGKVTTMGSDDRKHYILSLDSERRSSQHDPSAAAAKGEPVLLLWQEFLNLIPIDAETATAAAAAASGGRAKNSAGYGSSNGSGGGGGIASTSSRSSNLRRAAHQQQHDQRGTPPPQFNEGQALRSPNNAMVAAGNGSPLSLGRKLGLKRKRAGGFHDNSEGASDSNRPSN
eukprot:gene13391-18769_t